MLREVRGESFWLAGKEREAARSRLLYALVKVEVAEEDRPDVLGVHPALRERLVGGLWDLDPHVALDC